MVSGSELRRAGYIPNVQDGDQFVLGNMSPRVQAVIEAGKPAEVPVGQWLRHLHDLAHFEHRLVRFRQNDDPLSEFCDVEDEEAACQFVARYGFPVNGAFGVFAVGEVKIAESPWPVQVTISRPLARIPDIIEEAGLFREISRLREVRRAHTIHSTELQRIELAIRRFANREMLPQLDAEDSSRLFDPTNVPATAESVWKLALTVADARFRRLCPPKGSLESTLATYEPQSILGLIYWMLRRVLIGYSPDQKRCQNPKCNRSFTPSRSSVKYCSESCRRQVSDQKRSDQRRKIGDVKQ